MRTIKNIMVSVSILLMLTVLHSCEKQYDEINPAAKKPVATIDTTRADSSKIVDVPKPVTPAPGIEIANYYVATNGNDNNPGTIDSPFVTWQKAFDVAKAGDVVYFRGGVYKSYVDNNNGVSISNLNGTPDKWIYFMNYPGEVPVLDGSSMGTHTWFVSGIHLENCSYIYLKGLHIRNFTQYAASYARGFWAYNCTSITCDQLVVSQIQGCGIIILESLGGVMTVKNCDSYNNFDAHSATPGGNSDGIEVTHNSSNVTTYIKNNRSWFNGDDGIDVWHNEGAVTIDSNWVFRNGRASGDGSGIKLGVVEYSTGSRLVRKNLLFDNKDIGINDNDASSQSIVQNWYNNTSFRNGDDYYIYHDINRFNLSNNISYKNTIENNIVHHGTNIVYHTNSWNGFTLKDADFVSLDTTGVTGPRQSDGSLPVLNFLRLKSGSDLIDAGTDLGLPYSGTAVDLGSFEKQ